MRLRHLDADRPAADHDQMLGQFTVGKHGLVGQIGHLVEPGDRRRHRVRAGGDHEPAGADLDLAGQHRARAGETRGGAQHGDAQTLEPLRRIVRREFCDHLGDVVADRGEIDLRQRVGNAELRRAPPQLGAPSGGEQGFRRDAAEIQAVAAHSIPLDQHHLGAELRRPSGNREPAGASADDAQIGGERAGHAVGLRRQRLYHTGTSASTARARIGSSTPGLNRMLASGVSTTLLKPLPRLA